MGVNSLINLWYIRQDIHTYQEVQEVVKQVLLPQQVSQQSPLGDECRDISSQPT